MRLRTTILLVVIALASASVAASADVTVKKAPVSPTSPASGSKMFTTYCAVCHGMDAKGHGPAAPALKTPPADLTTLTIRNNGKFPELKVYGTIHGDLDMPAHGSRDMPIWGALFQSMSSGNQPEVQLRISNLTKYVESVQQR